MKIVSKDQERCYLSRDVKLIETMAHFLFEQKVGCRLDKIEVMLGTYYIHDRPDMEFLCYQSNTGQLIVEDNRHEVDAEMFPSYLYDGDNIDEWETAMAGADLEMGQFEENEDDVSNLFGDSS